MGLGPEFALCGVGFVGCVVWVLLDEVFGMLFF